MNNENIGVTKFREYLQINTEHPNPNYYKCVDFLYCYAEELGLDAWSYECVKGKPIVIFTLKGINSNLPSLMLYSHTDVVPSFPNHWKYHPFSAYKDKEGNIYGRGAQDMKCVGIQYIEAYRILKESGKGKFLRTIHFIWGPDEEIGGHDGMKKFVKTEVFKKLNIGFALDEGLAVENDIYRLYYGERSPWWVKFSCIGSPGHGSSFIENSVGPKLVSLLNSINNFREEQIKKLNDNPELKLGDVTSINITKIEGGVQTNVIPVEFNAWVDVRVSPFDKYEDIEELFKQWCAKAGDDVTYNFEQKNTCNVLTPITNDDPWWNALSETFKKMNLKYETEIFTGATDSRYLRELNYKAIGFSPIINTPQLLHDHNEFLNEQTFLNGVNIYVNIINCLANLSI